MFNSFTTWFDALSLTAIIAVWLLLLLFEMLALKVLKYDPKDHKTFFINLWLVFGVFLPAVWLLRAVENYYQIIPVGIMIIFFGVYKPTCVQTSDPYRHR